MGGAREKGKINVLGRALVFFVPNPVAAAKRPERENVTVIQVITELLPMHMQK